MAPILFLLSTYKLNNIIHILDHVSNIHLSNRIYVLIRCLINSTCEIVMFRYEKADFSFQSYVWKILTHVLDSISERFWVALSTSLFNVSYFLFLSIACLVQHVLISWHIIILKYSWTIACYYFSNKTYNPFKNDKEINFIEVK